MKINGKIFARIREHKGLSQAQLAAKCKNLTQRTIARWEGLECAGVHPGKIAEAADGMRISLDDLLAKVEVIEQLCVK